MNQKTLLSIAGLAVVATVTGASLIAATLLGPKSESITTECIKGATYENIVDYSKVENQCSGVVAPVVTPEMKKEMAKITAEVEAEAEATLAAEAQNPVKRQLPYECLSGGLSEYERDMMCGLQNERSDQFVQNHREAFLQDENGNYINK